MKKSGIVNCFILISFIIISCNQKQTYSSFLAGIKKLDYSSASAVEYYKGKLYVMGDDAPAMIVLDTNLDILDSLPIILFPGNRIPKNIKPDLEAASIYFQKNEPLIYLFGSGSLEPYRNAGWKCNLNTKTKDNIYLQPLYARIKKMGIAQINIEGACYLPGKLLLVNRGNKGYPYNHLIVIDEKFLGHDSSYQVSVIHFETQKDTAAFKGISGLCHSNENDRLIMTVSTEDTRSVYEDGTIGKSYLWIIDNISTKLKSASLKPDIIIDLDEIDSRFKGQKIESATVIEEIKDSIRLVLVADNDDGTSTIFKMSIKKN